MRDRVVRGLIENDGWKATLLNLQKDMKVKNLKEAINAWRRGSGGRIQR